MIAFELEQTPVGGGCLIELFSLVMNEADRRINFRSLLAAPQSSLQLDQRFISSSIEMQRHGSGE